MRGATPNGSNRDGPRRWPHPPATPYQGAAPEERDSPAQVLNEIALGVWVCVSILGIVLGLTVASLAQVWARSVLVPGAVLGALLVVVSLGVTVVATGRYLWRGALPPLGRRDSSRALANMSAFIVGMLAWTALAVIFC